MNIHEGKLAEFKEAVRGSMAFLEANGPQMMAGLYIDEEQMVANGLQVHRNSEFILLHWKIADPYMRDVMQYSTTVKVELYGNPSDAVMQGMERLSAVGATISVRPRLVGFTRFPDAAPA